MINLGNLLNLAKHFLNNKCKDIFSKIFFTN